MVESNHAYSLCCIFEYGCRDNPMETYASLIGMAVDCYLRDASFPSIETLSK